MWRLDTMFISKKSVRSGNTSSYPRTDHGILPRSSIWLWGNKLLENWYILKVLSGQDETVENTLRGRGYNVYMPYIIEVRVHRRYKCKIHRTSPLFPGYMFVSLSSCPDWRRLNSIKGVIGPLMADGRPAPMHSGEVTLIMEAEALGHFVNLPNVQRGFRIGDDVSFEMFGRAMKAVVKSFVGKEELEVVGDTDLGHFRAVKKFDELSKCN